MSEGAKCCGAPGLRGGRPGLYLAWFLRRWYLSHTEGSEGVDHTASGEELSGLNIEQMQVSQGGRGMGVRNSQEAAWWS